MIKKSSTLKDLAQKLTKDAEHRKEYRRQRPYHDLLVEIIQRRTELGLTQKELAKRANTYQSRISRVETGEYDIRLSTLINISEALGTRVEIRLIPVYEPDEQEWEKLKTILAESHDVPVDYSSSQASKTVKSRMG